MLNKRKALGVSLITPLFFFLSFLYSQEILWEKRIDIGIRDYMGGFVIFPDRNIGIIGTSIIDTIPNFFIYKISPNGDSILLKVFPQRCSVLYISNVLMDEEGNIYCVGNGESSGWKFGFIAKFSSNLEFIFRKNFYYSGWWSGFKDLVLVNNSIFVCGFCSASSGSYGILAKLDKEGNLLWQRLFPYHEFRSIKNINEYLFLTGNNSSLYWYLTFIKMDTLGNTLFIKRDFEGTGLSQALDSFGNILIAGSYNIYPGPYPIYLLRYDQNGNLLLANTYLYSDWDWAFDIEVNHQSEIFLANSFETYNPHIIKWHLIKYDSNGQMMWEHFYSLPDSLTWATKLMLLNRNEIIVGGYASIYLNRVPYYNIVIIKYLDNSYIKERVVNKNFFDSSITKIYDISGRRVYKMRKRGIYILENNKGVRKLIKIK